MSQFCPICRAEVTPRVRYPRYLCAACMARATAPDGGRLEFFNASMSGGYAARYAETKADYPSHDCVVDGVRCRADEAYMGGIVIQPAD